MIGASGYRANSPTSFHGSGAAKDMPSPFAASQCLPVQPLGGSGKTERRTAPTDGPEHAAQ
jgi:hypothetical protein